MLLLQPYSAQSAFVIHGVVLEVDTDRPLEGVTVTAVSNEHAYSAITDLAGNFTIEGAAIGRYVVTPERNGMIAARPARFKTPREPGAWVEIFGAAIPELQLRMVRQAVITGRLVDSAGNVFPATRGKVDILRYTYDERGRKKLEIAPVTHQGPMGTYGRMGDRGEFRLYGLQEGDYYVAASGGSSGRSFYPGTADESSAQAIHVNAGEEVRLTTITLPVQQRSLVTFRLNPTVRRSEEICLGKRLGAQFRSGRSAINGLE
jgi:hypothetical protein